MLRLTDRQLILIVQHIATGQPVELLRLAEPDRFLAPIPTSPSDKPVVFTTIDLREIVTRLVNEVTVERDRKREAALKSRLLLEVLERER